jgi:hypothetical protein
MEIHACSSFSVLFYAVSSKNVVAQEKIKKKLIKVESKHPVTAEMHQKNDSIKKN